MKTSSSVTGKQIVDFIIGAAEGLRRTDINRLAVVALEMLKPPAMAAAFKELKDSGFVPQMYEAAYEYFQQRDADTRPRPHAVICPTHGQVFLAELQYVEQMQEPERPWLCPRCARIAAWDDKNYQEIMQRPFEWRSKGQR